MVVSAELTVRVWLYWRCAPFSHGLLTVTLPAVSVHVALFVYKLFTQKCRPTVKACLAKLPPVYPPEMVFQLANGLEAAVHSAAALAQTAAVI